MTHEPSDPSRPTDPDNPSPDVRGLSCAERMSVSGSHVYSTAAGEASAGLMSTATFTNLSSSRVDRQSRTQRGGEQARFHAPPITVLRVCRSLPFTAPRPPPPAPSPHPASALLPSSPLR